MDKLNVFGGTGFIGSKFCELFPEGVVLQERSDNIPKTDNILYFISTTDNYNVFSNVTLDAKTNIIKLLEVLENCVGKEVTFNFISSWFVYGDCVCPALETYTCNPKGFYSITKKCAEDLLISFCSIHNIKYRIFRLANVVGKTDKGVSSKKNALQFLINEMKQNKDISLYHGGNFLRDYITVDDVCIAINECILHSNCNEIINIGSGVGYVFSALIDAAKKKLKSNSIIYKKEPTDFHKIVQVRDMYLEINKLKGITKFRPKYGINHIIDYLV